MKHARSYCTCTVPTLATDNVRWQETCLQAHSSDEVSNPADRRLRLRHHIEHLAHCGSRSPQIKHGLEGREADEGTMHAYCT